MKKKNPIYIFDTLYSTKINRGGSWEDTYRTRISFTPYGESKYGGSHNIGFRLCRTIKGDK
jgi:hypothetical protein